MLPPVLRQQFQGRDYFFQVWVQFQEKGFLFLQSPVSDSMKGSGQKPSSLLSPSLLLEEEDEGFEPTVKRSAI